MNLKVGKGDGQLDNGSRSNAGEPPGGLGPAFRPAVEEEKGLLFGGILDGKGYNPFPRLKQANAEFQPLQVVLFSQKRVNAEIKIFEVKPVINAGDKSLGPVHGGPEGASVEISRLRPLEEMGNPAIQGRSDKTQRFHRRFDVMGQGNGCLQISGNVLSEEKINIPQVHAEEAVKLFVVVAGKIIPEPPEPIAALGNINFFPGQLLFFPGDGGFFAGGGF